MAGSFKATGMAKFEDFLRIQNQSESRNSLQRVHNTTIDSIGRVDQVPLGQTKVQPSKFSAISGIDVQLSL